MIPSQSNHSRRIILPLSRHSIKSSIKSNARWRRGYFCSFHLAIRRSIIVGALRSPGAFGPHRPRVYRVPVISGSCSKSGPITRPGIRNRRQSRGIIARKFSPIVREINKATEHRVKSEAKLPAPFTARWKSTGEIPFERRRVWNYCSTVYRDRGFAPSPLPIILLNSFSKRLSDYQRFKTFEFRRFDEISFSF